MADKPLNVLFLCTGNSARSVIAESILNSLAFSSGRFKAFSAGSFPKGEVHPLALKVLRDVKLPTEDLRSKSWDEFAAPGAPQMDFVFTVCDNAAREVCPVWPGQPMSAHWGIEDPAAFEGSEQEMLDQFKMTMNQLRNRISIFTSLPFEKLDKLSLQKKLDEIGKVEVLNA
jgi:protein-tyrosine-phosphatase